MLDRARDRVRLSSDSHLDGGTEKCGPARDGLKHRDSNDLASRAGWPESKARALG